jgi:hypothetical protein
MQGSEVKSRLLLAAVLAGASALAGPVLADEAWKQGNSKAAGLEQCVEPTDWMRRNHMELIKHQRYKTVHQGVRIESKSLAGCVYCHVQYDAAAKPIAINSDGQFCDRCHDYAAVTLDCFQCHATVPTSETNYGAGAGEGIQR